MAIVLGRTEAVALEAEELAELLAGARSATVEALLMVVKEQSANGNACCSQVKQHQPPVEV